MKLKTIGVLLILTGLLLGLGYQSGPLKTGVALLCMDREDAIPAEIERNPYQYLQDSSYSYFPAELTCKWETAGEIIVTRIRMNVGVDILATASLGGGLALLLWSLVLRRGKRESMRRRAPS